MACTCNEMGARVCDDCIGTGRADAAERSIASPAARERFKQEMIRQIRTKGEARIPMWMWREGWPGYRRDGEPAKPLSAADRAWLLAC